MPQPLFTKPLMFRIKLALLHATSGPYNIREKKPDEELVVEMKSLLEEILSYIEHGVIVKSKEYKNLIL